MQSFFLQEYGNGIPFNIYPAQLDYAIQRSQLCLSKSIALGIYCDIIPLRQPTITESCRDRLSLISLGPAQQTQLTTCLHD